MINEKLNYLLSTSFSPSCDCGPFCSVALDSGFNTGSDKPWIRQLDLPSFALLSQSTSGECTDMVIWGTLRAYGKMQVNTHVL